MCSDIDFVIPWVDGSDTEWQKLKASYSNDESKASASNGVERYRDWGILPYWFRAVEKYAPWVRRIHFITCGQVPEWLNLNHPKLHFVKHEDYIPREWLPVFSANPIELNIFRIEGLSEKFVYFNDDMFLNAAVKPEDFFRKGLPCAVFMPSFGYLRWGMDGIVNIIVNNLIVINKNFKFIPNFIKNFTKWVSFRYGVRYAVKNFLLFMLLLPFKTFTGFREYHTVNSFLKSTFIEVWEKEHDLLAKTSSHKFRARSDVNQWLMEKWQLASGKFYPGRPSSASYSEERDIADCVKDIKTGRHKIICINDNEALNAELFGEFSRRVREAYSEVFPEKSAFEL